MPPSSANTLLSSFTALSDLVHPNEGNSCYWSDAAADRFSV
jgi:hypothetical protein